MAKELTERLLELKKSTETSKEEKSRAEGELDGMMKRLQNDYKLRTIPAAKKRLGELEKEIEGLDKDLEKGVTELEEKYEWN
jgi:hypothetical protein